jgi:hypothetical protein
VAAVALWVVVRFPALAPRTAVGVVGWLAAAVTLTLAARPVFVLIGPVAGPLPALVLVELGSGVCMMLSVAWTTRWIIQTMGSASH